MAPVDDGNWYYYDNGINEDAIGTGGGNFYWGIMLPAGSFEGNTVSKVSAYDYMSMSGTVTIHNGGSTAPGTALGSTNVTFNGTEDFVEFTFEQPVVVDPTQNVWVVFYNASAATYPAAVCANTGDANGRWVSIDGTDWMDLVSAGLSNTFMVRAYIETGSGSTSTAIEPNKFNIFMDGEFIAATGDNTFNYTVEDFEEHTFEVYYVDEEYNFSCPASIVMGAGTIEGITDLNYTFDDPYVTLTWNGTAENYIVWRGLVDMSTGQVNLDIIGETNNTTYTDEVPSMAGYILYTVQSVIGECETDLQTELDNGNYILFQYDDVNESEIVNAIYPNPTSGDLHINAEAMTHISVFNAMGQMVYNADVNSDEIILNMGQYNAGMYMVNIVTKNGSTVKRVIVTK